MPNRSLDRLAALAELGLGADASPRDIVSAYRRLARSSHPDTAPKQFVGPAFADIAAAYRFLTAAADVTSPVPDPPAGPFVGGIKDVREFLRWNISPAWPDSPPLTAGPVIIRPLPPEFR